MKTKEIRVQKGGISQQKDRYNGQGRQGLEKRPFGFSTENLRVQF